MSNHKYLLHNITVNYGFRCHGDQHYNHTALPDQTRTYLDSTRFIYPGGMEG